MLRIFYVVSILCWMLALRVSAADAPGEDEISAALKRAAESKKPVLILVRNQRDLGTVDCAHWIAEDKSLQDVLSKFERAVVWHRDDALAGLDAPESGLLFLTSAGETICVTGVPAYRSAFKESLEQVLANPISIDSLAASVSAELAKGNAQPTIDTTHFKEAMQRLRSLGRNDEALPIQRVLAGINLLNKTGAAEEDALETAALELDITASIPGLLKKIGKKFEKFHHSDKPDPRPVRLVLRAAARTAAFSENAKKTLAPAQEAFAAYEKTPDSADAVKAAREALGKAAGPLKAESEELKKPIKDLEAKFGKAHPDSLRAKFHEFSELFEKLGQAEADKRCTELLNELLKRPMKPDEFLEVAGYLNYPIIMMQLGPERVALAERVQKEIRTGHFAADIYMDQADIYVTEGKFDEAEKLWKLVEEASRDGESPSYLFNLRSMRALLDKSTSPAQSKWAERTVLNTVVLAPDFESYANAIAQWTDKEFFPVLFQDDIYAPKFIAAFKPANVIVLPPGAAAKNTPLPITALRRAILGSWSAPEAKQALAQEPTDDLLRARLKELNTAPLGVVFGDGESGEMAGALALAAGRFQGLEILQRPSVGNEGHIGSEDHYLDFKRAWALNTAVRDALKRWGLPHAEQWGYVTLAGKYPYRYFGEETDWGTTYATDDLLGRNEDFMRIAVCGRLMGDHARSAYQAMCSLFLQPESTFLFNTYGTNPHSEWGQYNMVLAETLLKERMKVTHFHDEGANIDTFRAHVVPWNKDGLIFINSSGSPDSWSVGGGGGTPEDFVVGAPCAIHIVHSGSAADLYNTETIAHRAVWGGAFWYYGSSAEPLLEAFNPLNYVSPRIVRGVPLAAAFRQRSAQNFYYPWRLMLVGDPQFCLREQPAKRSELSDAVRKALLPAGAPPLSEKPSWTEALRQARFNNAAAKITELLQHIPESAQLDGAGAAIAIEELNKADRCADALKLWNGISDEARKNYAAKVYARYAAGHLMDVAQTAKDFKALTAAFTDLLTSEPARNYVDRWSSHIATQSKEQKADAAYLSWLTDVSANPRTAAFQKHFQAELLARKEKWSPEDKSAALATFAELVKAQGDPNQLAAPFKTLASNYLGKLPGATQTQLFADTKALFKEDAPEFKRLLEAMVPYQVSQQLFKDWLILGPFKDQKIGAWENVGPRDGKTAPDFSAKFTDGAALEWTRLFKDAAPGTIDLIPVLKPNMNVYVYAAAAVAVEKDVDALLLLGSDDGITAWLDGREIHRNAVNRGVTVDQDKVSLKLTAGAHSLVLRIDQGTGGWGFCARVADKDGKLMPAGVSLHCPRE